MTRTNIPIQELARNGGNDNAITWTAGDATNDHDFVNTGREIVLMKNDSIGALSADVISVADEYGRTGDTTLTPGASAIAAAGPFPPTRWNSASGKAYIDLTDDTSISFAVIKFSRDG